MVRRLVAFVAALLLLVPATALGGLTRSEAALLREINRVRHLHGLGALRYDGRLERAARVHTREMLHAGVLRHGPVAARLLEFRVKGGVTGEDLGWGAGAAGAPPAIVAMWLASPVHRAILLRPGFTRVGIGAIVGAFLGAHAARVVTADFAG